WPEHGEAVRLEVAGRGRAARAEVAAVSGSRSGVLPGWQTPGRMQRPWPDRARVGRGRRPGAAETGTARPATLLSLPRALLPVWQGARRVREQHPPGSGPPVGDGDGEIPRALAPERVAGLLAGRRPAGGRQPRLGPDHEQGAVGQR